MPSINRGGRFLLAEAVIKTASKNRLAELLDFHVTASVNTPSFKGSHVINDRLSKKAQPKKPISARYMASNIYIYCT